MIAECEVKPISILCFEDNSLTREILETYLTARRPMKIKFWKNYLGCEPILNTHLVDQYDIIIADCMTPFKDAFGCIESLANCGKTVIFYTCLDMDIFVSRCKEKLGHVPFNFKFVNKHKMDNLQLIDKLIENELC